MTSRIILLCIFSLASMVANAELTRSIFLGVSPTNSGSQDGVEVNSLHPLGTGKSIGMQNGDKILSVNQQTIGDFAQLVSALSSVTEGEKLSIKVKRGDKVMLLSGEAMSRPKESGANFETEYGQLNWQGNQIRTITYHPRSARKDKAGVMFIQGYTCDSIDYGMAPNITITQLLSEYAQAGFTVFKMEKPGVGDSEGPLACEDYDFDTENAAFTAGLKHFSTFKQVDANNLFVFGHSLGVLHAATIAEKGLAKGVMGYGGVLKSWYDYLQDIYTDQSVQYFGTDPKQAAANLKTIKPFLNDWLNTDKNWNELVSSETGKEAVQSDLLPLQGQRIFSRHYSFFRSLNKYDFTKLWSKSQSHALLMHGTYDIQAIEGSWASKIADLVSSQGKHDGKAMSFPRTEHSLMRYKSLDSLRQAMRRGNHRPGNPGERYNPDIAKSSLQWMQSILEKKVS